MTPPIGCTIFCRSRTSSMSTTASISTVAVFAPWQSGADHRSVRARLFLQVMAQLGAPALVPSQDRLERRQQRSLVFGTFAALDQFGDECLLTLDMLLAESDMPLDLGKLDDHSLVLPGSTITI